MRAARGLHEDGERSRPFFHPVHGHAAKKRTLCASVKLSGTWMVGRKALGLALMQSPKLVPVQSGHDRRQDKEQELPARHPGNAMGRQRRKLTTLRNVRAACGVGTVRAA